ncbi:hypothetical protein RFI_24861, partial [Reticulomyxa filosa]
KSKILRRTYLHILWNILKYPKHIKYRQINNQALCNKLIVEMSYVRQMEMMLQHFGFKKENDDNWYCQYDIQIPHLWNCYKKIIYNQIMYMFMLYKTRNPIPNKVCMPSNGKWKDYEVAFDYEHRTIMLFDENKLKIKSLQVGNPKISSLEFNIHIQWQNYIDFANTHTKWGCLEFNSFHVIWKTLDNAIHKEPLNPYSMTLRQGADHIAGILQMRAHFIFGADELIYVNCRPAIPLKKNNEHALLHDIYKHLPQYPTVQVHWEIDECFVVSYKHTISIERSHLPEKTDLDVEFIPSDQKTNFNPLLYERDLQKLKVMQDTIHIKMTRNNPLQKLFHEVIKNDYLYDLITLQYQKDKKKLYENIKKQINYNKKDENGGLILNDKILTIVNELKILYHDDIHKKMGYPLQLWHICAILFYDQIKFKHHNWPYLDRYLCDA